MMWRAISGGLYTAESALQNIGAGATTGATALKIANAPERMFRLPLPGISLADLQLPPKAQARMDALLPGGALAAAAAAASLRRPAASAPPSSMFGLYGSRASTPGMPLTPGVGGRTPGVPLTPGAGTLPRPPSVL
jgi:hypothetical protein